MGKHNKENRSLLRQIVNIILVVSFLWVLSISNLTENPIFAIEITLSDIIINNRPQKIPKTNVVPVRKNDAVRISGLAKPNSTVIITIAHHELEKTVSDAGTWFVLFSISNMEKGEYIVKTRYNNSELDTSLITLLVTDKITTLRENELKQEQRKKDYSSNTNTDVQGLNISQCQECNTFIPTLIFSSISLSFGLFLGIAFGKINGGK